MNRRRVEALIEMKIISDYKIVAFFMPHTFRSLRRVKHIVLPICVGLLLFIPSCQPAFAEPITLTASFYSLASLKKEGTFKYSKGVQANGKLFDENALTCASCDFPLKTKLRVTTVKDPKKSVIVEVTDRTNKRFKGKRVDLSKRAFGELTNDQWTLGIIQVTVEKL